MKRETLVIRPEKYKRRIGVLPTYAQRDRTKYTRKAKHRGGNTHTGERHGKIFADIFPCRFYAVKAGLAQTEEQTPRKRQVRSSILRSGTKLFRVRLAVGQRPLTPRTVVRIHDPEPIFKRLRKSGRVA